MSRLYFGDSNIKDIFVTLIPLHNILNNSTETLREVSFAQVFGRDLTKAKHFYILYLQTREIGDLNQTWDLYYKVFRKISR